MNRSLRLASLVASLAALPLAGVSQTAPAKTRPHAKKKVAPTVQQQIQELRHELQGEIDELKTALAAKDAQISALETATVATQQKTATQVDTINAALQQNVVVEKSLKDSVGELQVKTMAAVTSAQEAKASEKALEKAVNEPLSLHYKGVTLTPGGFIAAESIWRQRALNSDIFTNFNATPYMNSGEAKTSEWVPSARATRPNLLLSGKVPFGTINAFLEGDFLSAGTTSNSLQTNSYTLRLRQAWAQVATSHLKFTGGQMWTLATENKKATDANTEWWPMVPDGNAHVGFSYLRQTGFRLQDTVRPGLTLAMSLEASQYQFAATNAPTNFFFGSAGAAGGLNNSAANYTNQVAPDIIVKAAYDTRFGHYELGGIGRFFRDRYYPNGTSSKDAQNDTRFGGGFIANARFPVTPKLDLGVHLIAGDGTGRYGDSLLPDITVRPDGTLAPLRNAQGMFTLEAHPNKKLDLFAYTGTEYVQRSYRESSTGTLVGYAPPSASNTGCNVEAVPTAGTGYAPGATTTCLGATRALIEGSAGWVFRIYSGPVGRLQYAAAYSYLTREAWTGVGGAPKATNNMVYTSFRYYLP